MLCSWEPQPSQHKVRPFSRTPTKAITPRRALEKDSQNPRVQPSTSRLRKGFVTHVSYGQYYKSQDYIRLLLRPVRLILIEEPCPFRPTRNIDSGSYIYLLTTLSLRYTNHIIQPTLCFRFYYGSFYKFPQFVEQYLEVQRRNNQAVPQL